MRKIFLLINICFAISYSQTINIPDAHFKAMLLAANSTNTIAATGPLNNLTNVKIDTNNDGQIQVSEVQDLTYLLLLNSQISDLTGIEYFTNLIYLNFGQNSITSLNLSQLTQLQRLGCYQNNIASLNLSTLTHLQYLFCQQNQITSLNFSNNPQLTTVYCGNNQISSLDFSANPLFNELGCRNNLLTSLNIKNGITQLFGAQTLYNECWTGNPNLTSICADAFEIPALQNYLQGCGITQAITIDSACPLLGNDGFEKAPLNLYPNPTNDKVTLDNSEAHYNNVIVYNYLGQEVTQQKLFYTNTQDIDLSEFSSGVYLFKLQGETSSETVKVVKK